LEAVFEQQARHLASGLPHDQYLFTCGALYAIQRIYNLPQDILNAVTSAEEFDNVRKRSDADRLRRAANTFVSTPWWDTYIRDAASRRANGAPGTETL
jgi:hypothetical protein